ncbi:MAG TPA: hypothetical protein VEZ17_04030 [Chitinophagaceae bacterium]|jgi:hypothetical protein|nr:hypothetical protein [Chitinophagaceae bacterium]
MNKSPLNYLITIALGIVLWVITAVFYGVRFSESLIFVSSTPEDFLASLRIILGFAALSGITNALYWFYYGNLTSTAGELDRAKRVWWVSFILQVIASVVLLFILIFMYLDQNIATSGWLISYALISLLTWFFFWLTTFMMSPRTVKFIPLFK